MARDDEDLEKFKRHVLERMADLRGELLFTRVMATEVAYRFLKQSSDIPQDWENMRSQSRDSITGVQIAGRADEEMMRIVLSTALKRHEQTFEELSRALELRKGKVH